MPYLNLGGQKLFYAYKREQVTSTNLVLIHGAGSNHLGWPAQLRRMPGCAVYTLDLPGHGRSTPPSRESIDAYADDVASFLDALQLTNVVVLGHSMGGAVGQKLALRYPDKLVGLILIGTGARLPVSNQILDKVKSDFEAVVNFITKLSWARGTSSLFVQGGRKLLRETDPSVLYGDFVACNSFDVRAQIGQFQTPTLIITGSHDMMTPPKFGEFLAENIPNAELITIDGGGHMMMLEQAEVVGTAVAEFLSANFK